MNKVQAKYRAKLAALTGTAEEPIEAQDVEDLLRSLEKRHGREAGKTARTMLIAVNGESIHLLKHYRTALKEGDVVSFFPICAGG